MLDKMQDARITFCAAYQTHLEAPKLRWPAWLVEFRSQRKLHAATKEAGLPRDFAQDIAIVAFTLDVELGRAPPPTNKDVRKCVDRSGNALRRARAILDPPHLPDEIEARLPVDFHSFENDDGSIECVFAPSPVGEIRVELDRLIQHANQIKLPPRAQSGPKISPVTSAVWLLVGLARAHKPDISSRTLTELARTVLEPAVNNHGSLDGARIDWNDQVSRALRDLSRLTTPDA